MSFCSRTKKSSMAGTCTSAITVQNGSPETSVSRRKGSFHVVRPAAAGTHSASPHAPLAHVPFEIRANVLEPAAGPHRRHEREPVVCREAATLVLAEMLLDVVSSEPAVVAVVVRGKRRFDRRGPSDHSLPLCSRRASGQLKASSLAWFQMGTAQQGPAKAGHYDFSPVGLKPDTTTPQRVASDTGDSRRENSQYGLVRIVL
jgi:hypothetical protein